MEWDIPVSSKQLSCDHFTLFKLSTFSGLTMWPHWGTTQWSSFLSTSFWLEKFSDIVFTVSLLHIYGVQYVVEWLFWPFVVLKNQTINIVFVCFLFFLHFLILLLVWLEIATSREKELLIVLTHEQTVKRSRSLLLLWKYILNRATKKEQHKPFTLPGREGQVSVLYAGAYMTGSHVASWLHWCGAKVKEEPYFMTVAADQLSFPREIEISISQKKLSFFLLNHRPKLNKKASIKIVNQLLIYESFPEAINLLVKMIKLRYVQYKIIVVCCAHCRK